MLKGNNTFQLMNSNSILIFARDQCLWTVSLNFKLRIKKKNRTRQPQKQLALPYERLSDASHISDKN